MVTLGETFSLKSFFLKGYPLISSKASLLIILPTKVALPIFSKDALLEIKGYPFKKKTFQTKRFS